MPDRQKPQWSFPAVQVFPGEDGFCPVLAPCQYCKDGLQGLWHFCTPDAYHFAIDQSHHDHYPDDSIIRVAITSKGISILPRLPPFCASRRKMIANSWLLKDGFWFHPAGS